ncbi:MAG: GrpB family protein [Thermoplasmata archaeon]
MDEQIRKATIGEPVRLDGPILLAEYDPAWPEQFAREAARIRSILRERVLRIEHIGSTSVPGLVAKPIIDILLVVADSADEPSYVPALEGAGYVLRIREVDWYQHRLLKGPDTNINLHVFSLRCPEIERVVTLRDRLRADPGERERYARAKRSLASRKWKYVQNYADAKSEIIETILSNASASSSRTKPGAPGCRSREKAGTD